MCAYIPKSFSLPRDVMCSLQSDARISCCTHVYKLETRARAVSESMISKDGPTMLMEAKRPAIERWLGAFDCVFFPLEGC